MMNVRHTVFLACATVAFVMLTSPSMNTLPDRMSVPVNLPSCTSICPFFASSVRLAALMVLPSISSVAVISPLRARVPLRLSASLRSLMVLPFAASAKASFSESNACPFTSATASTLVKLIGLEWVAVITTWVAR